MSPAPASVSMLTSPGRFDRAAKRAIDIVGAVVGLIVLSPILAGAAIGILLTDGRPILFRHDRPGRGGKLFKIAKFRTMRSPQAGEVWYRTDADRITRVGRLLRSTSIDELPELWNVLRGDMSLVGPRPLLIQYLDSYTETERIRHVVRPGITGWAAVNGRHVARFEDRLALDVWYVEHWSLALDFRIIGRTVSQVLRRTNVAAIQDLDEIDFPPRFETGLEQRGEPLDGRVRPDDTPPADG